MSTPARKRLMRDFKRLQQDPPAGISGAPQDNNITLWNAVIFGYVSEGDYTLLPISVFLHFDGFFLKSRTILFMYFIVWIAGLMTPHGMEVKTKNLISYCNWIFLLSRLIFKLYLVWYFCVFQVRLSWHFNSQRIIQISHQQCVLFLGCFIQIVSSKQKLHTHMYARITFVHVLVHMCAHTNRNMCMFIEYWIILHPFTYPN